jgi:uncharacterized protein (TIGR02271 family)
MQSIVKDIHGQQAVFKTADLDNRHRVPVVLPDGTTIHIAGDMFNKTNGIYTVSLAFDQIKNIGSDGRSEAVVLPVHEERLKVGKEWHATGKVRVIKTVHEEEHLIDEPLLREEIDVRRETRDEMVDAPAGPRYEDNVLVIPVYEEVIVVEKRLRLKEEIYVSKRRTEQAAGERVTTRREEIRIDRSDT